MQVKRVGSVLHTDSQGFLVKEASKDKIIPPWSHAVDAVVEAYIRNLSDKLHSIYVRGSIAKGQAVEGLSDVDTLALMNVPVEACDMSWTKEFEQIFRPQFSFADGAELQLVNLERLLDLSDPKLRSKRLIIKTQAVCVYGEDLTGKLPDFKPGPDTKIHTQHLEREIKELLSNLPDAPPEKVKVLCRWISKRIVRTGYEMVMKREQAYTRDLYPCYEGFIKYYPGHSDAMMRAVDFAINPTSDKSELEQFLQSFGLWLAKVAMAVDQQ